MMPRSTTPVGDPLPAQATGVDETRGEPARKLAGKVAIISGGAGDIGRAIARRFLQAGACVALLDRRQPELDEAAARLAPSDRVLALACDITDPAQSHAAVTAVAARWRQVDILVNNAATDTPSAPVAQLGIEDWRRTLEVNVTGAWLLCRSCLPLMIAAQGGVVLNIASQLGQVAAAGRGAYGVSKAALIALARAIAVDHAAQGIRAVSLSPGAIMTGRLLDRYGDEDAVGARLAPRYPMGRIGTADEVAAAALFLASDDASFVTGTDLMVDGGYTAI